MSILYLSPEMSCGSEQLLLAQVQNLLFAAQYATTDLTCTRATSQQQHFSIVRLGVR